METPLTQNINPEKGPCSLKDYIKTGGYSGVAKALTEMTSPQITQAVRDSNLWVVVVRVLIQA